MNTPAAPVGYVLALLAGLVAISAAVLLWARAAVINETGFTENAVAAAADPAVQQELATVIVNQMVAAQPLLRLSRPVLQLAAEGAVGTDAFRKTVFADAVRNLHRTAFEPGRQQLVLDLSALIDLVVAEVDRLQNRINLADLQLDSNAGEVALQEIGALRSGARAASRIDAMTPWLPLIAVALLGAGLLLGRWDVALAAFAIGAVGGTLIGWLALSLARSRAWARLDDEGSRAAASAVWDAFLPPLPQALVMFAALAVVVAVAGLVLRALFARRRDRVRYGAGERYRSY